MDEGKEDDVKVDPEFEGLVDKATSKRGRLRRELFKKDPELAKSFMEQSPEQVAWGQLVGKLTDADSNAKVEDAFTWFSNEHNKGIALRNPERIMAFFHALASSGCDDAKYRVIRQMYVKANVAD